MAAPVQTSNQVFFDALIRHQIFLLRGSRTLANEIIALLNATERDLERRILKRLANAKGGLGSPRELKRMQVLIEAIRNVRGAAWKRVGKHLNEQLTLVALQEPSTVLSLLRTALPVLIDPVLPNPATLRAIVRSRPFEGHILRDWARKLEAEDLRQIERAVQIGMVQGETAQQVARRVLGSKALGGVDGATQSARNASEAIARTAINHVGSSARAELYAANADLFQFELYVATLDSRTTPQCRAYDGNRYEIGSGPIPPVHYSCRSLRAPVIGAGPISQRPMKPTTERQLVQEFADSRALGKVSSRAKLPRGTKGQFDAFARRRTRELIGRVPAKTSYGEWLKTQSAGFQDDVLGPTRARLFRKGGLALDKFIARDGSQIPLAQLSQRHADAFRAAGIDPDGFH